MCENVYLLKIFIGFRKFIWRSLTYGGHVFKCIFILYGKHSDESIMSLSVKEI